MRRLLFFLAACGGANQPPHAASSSMPHDHQHRPFEGAVQDHHFKKAEEWAVKFDDPSRIDWQKPDLVVAALELQPNMVVADIGAGTGYFEARLAAAVEPKGRVLALDAEPDMVRYLRERAIKENTPSVEAFVAAPDDPRLPDASVDRILIVNTWHHIEAREAYARKLAAALKPGGFVLVVDFTQETDKGPPRMNRIRAGQVMRELESAGLRATILALGLPDQYVIKAVLTTR
jgi:ubiquinone/menaquinone biosynthesis C-methylase UbiE